MKKWINLFLITCLVFLVGCGKETPIPTVTQALEIKCYISPNDEGFRVVIGVDEDLLEVENIISYGLVFHNQNEGTLDSLVIGEETTNIELLATEETYYPVMFYEIIQANYQLPYHYRAYIKYESNKHQLILYANTIVTTSLYTLALEDLSTFSREVVGYVEGDLIEEVRLDVDPKNYIVEALNDRYQAEITTDYNFITVTVNLLQEAFFASGVKLIVNDEEIANNKWSISGNVLTYKFDDPNWTNPY